MLGDAEPSRYFTSTAHGEIEVVPLVRSEDVTGEDLRNHLDGLKDIPDDDPVGLVDASTDASTLTANVIVDVVADLALDTFVVSAQRLVDGAALFHYGVVTEVSSRIEGAEMATDTARLASSILPGERFRRAEVSWIRTDPEHNVPPSSIAPIWAATGIHRARALLEDKMSEGEGIPIGLDMNDEIVLCPYSFLNGERGAHVSISGKSGVATKSSYALFLLYMLFETEWGEDARAGSGHDRAVVFSVKGSDLCMIDKPNNRLHDEDEVGARAMDQWERLVGQTKPAPFSNVGIYAPALDVDVSPDPNRLRRDSEHTPDGANAYGWSPLRFVEAGLLPHLFDDLESGQHGLIEQEVRLELLRWAWPVEGDDGGKIILVEPVDDTAPNTWNEAAHHFETHKHGHRRSVKGDDTVVRDLDGLVGFIEKMVCGDADGPGLWNAGTTRQTQWAFMRRLRKALPRLRPLVREGLEEVDLSSRSISVIDIHALHADAQRFVVSVVLNSIWSEHEHSTAQGKTFVMLDELNRYSPRFGGSPVKHLLVDIAERGRSLGVVLIGAQQNPSEVDRTITNNAALEVVGQIKLSEASQLGFLPPAMQERARIVPPGTMITSQPMLPVPVPVRFPLPPFATCVAEVGESRIDETESVHQRRTSSF